MHVLMMLEKETPGALRYLEVDVHGNPVKSGYRIGTLYLRKSGFLDGYPKAIRVEVTWEE